MKKGYRQLKWPLLLLVWLCLNYVPFIFAHGGGKIQIENAPVGDCLASVWLNPSMPKANETIHITVGMSDKRLDFVLDSMVDINVIANDQVILSASATTEQSVNRLFYEADLDAIQAGRYDVALKLARPGCEGNLSFPMTVTQASYLRLYFMGGAVVLLVAFVWRWSKQQDRISKRPFRPRIDKR